MPAYHVALQELAVDIQANGLDPRTRAIFLLSEMPEEIDGFDLWEVDVDLAEDGNAVMWPHALPSALVKLAEREAAPAPMPGM